RFLYLRGQDGGAVLRQDLSAILESAHRRFGDLIRAYFDRPLLAAPVVDDPVSDFDLLTIADDASRALRRELQDLIIRSIHERIREVFRTHLADVGLREHLRNLFRGAPDRVRQLEGLLDRFEDTML